MSDDYNYATFPLDLDAATFAAFKGCLTAGERAPGGQLVDAHSGERVSLARASRDGPLVLEFGSHT